MLTINYGALEPVELVLDEPPSLNRRNENNSLMKNLTGIIIALLVTVSTIALVNHTSYFRSKAVFRSADVPVKTSDSFTFTLNRQGYDPILNFATASDSSLSYNILNDYIAVVEPFSDMSLYIVSASDDDVYYSFSITNVDGTVSSGLYYPSNSDHSTTAKSLCSTYDSLSVSVTQYSMTGTELATSTGSALCMYVRREIRSLSSTELSEFMDAMQVLWSTNDTIGQSVYGTNYMSASTMLNLHFYQSSWRDSDHAHEGLGFISHHVTMTNLIEKSLQSVNPSVTMPYWDFTIETASSLNITESPMFTADTFGSLSTDTTWEYSSRSVLDAKIPDGRFADLLVPYNTDFPEFNKAYGYMRGRLIIHHFHLFT